MAVVHRARRDFARIPALLSAAALIVGLGVSAISPPGLEFLVRIDRYFPPGGWRYSLWATAASTVFAGIFSLFAVILRWSLQGKADEFEWMESGSVAGTLEELRREVEERMLRREPDVTSAFDILLRAGLLLGASDIHFNPLRDALSITYRIDGVLHQAVTLPAALSARFSGRVKVLARLDSFSNGPQDGGLRRTVGDLKVEARVSCLPSNHGERIVLRLVRGDEVIPQVEDLGFEKETTTLFRALIDRPQGILYVSGPVGSGKTTTLYSLLQCLHQRRGETTSIVTLEDPIEVQLPFATQTQINRKVAMNFAQTLRSVLRQDPGAIMVGEIRDRETAEIATQAALTGHSILTTLHVQSAASTFARLIEMGIEPFLLASSCNATLAQRLVRELCPACRAPREASSEEIARFAELGIQLQKVPYFEASGCQICEKRGYLGRLPIGELLVVTEVIQEALRRRASSEEIHRIAVREGMTPLIQSGLRLAMTARTSLAEVLRVAG